MPLPGNRTRHLAQSAVFVAAALVLHYVESLFPPPVPALPMIKLGVANVVTLLALYLWGRKRAGVVMLLRAVLGPLLSGALTGVFYSVAGGLASLLVMSLLFRCSKWFSIFGVSVAGAFMHNVGQLLVAWWLLGQGGVWLYLPWLAVAAVATGFLVAAAAKPVLALFQKTHKIDNLSAPPRSGGQI
jgi:heptaprenyl diphosphate synthase